MIAALLAMTLMSSTFANGAVIPTSAVANRAGRCAGENESPAIAWRGEPAKTRAFALIAYDVTAHFTHWMVVGIPATTHVLRENASFANATFGMQLANSFGDARYDGPGRPDVAAGSDRDAVLRVVGPLTLASASVSGTYGAPK